MVSNDAAKQTAQQDDPRLAAGLYLRGLRETAGLSQKELASRIGLSYYTFISQIESGKGRIPSERYAAWAEALGQDPRDFAVRMLSFYEPHTHALIFGDQASA